MTDEAIKSYIKTVREEANEDMERYLGVLKEDYQDKLVVVAEVVSGIDQKLDKFIKKVGERFDGVEFKIGMMQSDFRLIKSDINRRVNYEEFTSLEQRVSKLEAK